MVVHVERKKILLDIWLWFWEFFSLPPVIDIHYLMPTVICGEMSAVSELCCIFVPLDKTVHFLYTLTFRAGNNA